MKFRIILSAAAIFGLMQGLGLDALAGNRERSDATIQSSAEHLAAYTDARVAALKAGLKLNAAQDKNWPSLETVLREVMKDRAARTIGWQQTEKARLEKGDVIENLKFRGKALSLIADELNKISDAAKPLYDSLDTAQQQRFGVLLREALKPHDHHWSGWSHAKEYTEEPDDADIK